MPYKYTNFSPIGVQIWKLQQFQKDDEEKKHKGLLIRTLGKTLRIFLKFDM